MTIGDPIHHRAAQARNDADDDPDDGAADGQHLVSPPILYAVEPSGAEHGALGDRPVLPQEGDDFGNRKYAEPDDDELQTIGQVGDVIGRHSERAAGIGLADGADQQAEPGRGQALQGHAAGENGDHGEAENRNHQHLGQAECQHDGPGDQNKESQKQGADQTAEQ